MPRQARSLRIPREEGTNRFAERCQCGDGSAGGTMGEHTGLLREQTLEPLDFGGAQGAGVLLYGGDVDGLHD